MRGIILVLAGALALTGCSKHNLANSNGGIQSSLMQVERILGVQSVLTVMGDDGQPVGNAQILIGSASGALKDNFITTDGQGHFSAPSSWTGAQAVTIQAAGYTRATYLGQSPGGQSFTVRRNGTHGSFEVTGTTPGVNVVADDGNAYFSLVIPVLQKTDLLHFNLGMVVSQQNDIISVVGQKVKVPSNLTIPKQDQSYIFPITLDKPNYRFYFNSPGPKRVLALAGRFPFHKVVDEIRGGTPFYMVANDLEMMSGGLQDITVSLGTTKLDIPVTQFTVSEARTLNSGSVADGEQLFGFSITNENGDLIPTDVKDLNANGATTLHVQAGASNVEILSVLKRKDEMKSGPGEDRLSAVIVPFADGVTPEHLPLLDNPKILADNSVQIQKVPVPAGITAVATYGSLQTLARVTLRNGKSALVATQVWEVYSPDWIDTMEVPAWPGDAPAPAAGSRRWSVALVGTSGKQQLDLGPSLMQSVTHVTNTSIDF